MGAVFAFGDFAVDGDHIDESRRPRTTALQTPFYFLKGHKVPPDDVSDLLRRPVITSPGLGPIIKWVRRRFQSRPPFDLALMGDSQAVYVNLAKARQAFAAPVNTLRARSIDRPAMSTATAI